MPSVRVFELGGESWPNRAIVRWKAQMVDIKGPAVDLEAFRVEGHCCGIRLPVLKELTGDGIQFELSPETKAELIAAGVLPAEGGNEPPKAEAIKPGASLDRN